MANQFGGISGKSAFTVGLLSSLFDTFKSDHDKKEKEDFERKQIDYEMVMNSIKDPDWISTHTPSQRQFAMEKALDILKPKGHQDIKEKLKGLFGGGEQYNPQASNILHGADSKPRLNVPTTVVQGGSAPSNFPNTGVTLPPPPSMTAMRPEKTFGEMDVENDVAKETRKSNAQMSMQIERERYDKQKREEQNQVSMDRIKLSKSLTAKAEVSKRAWLYNPQIGPADPAAFNLAAQSLREEIDQKSADNKTKMAALQTRLDAGAERLRIAESHLTLAQQRERRLQGQTDLKNDPQMKQAQAKINSSNKAALDSRQQAEIALATGNQAMAKNFFDEAAKYEAQAQTDTNAMEQMTGERHSSGGDKSGQVKLPSPPVSRRGAAKLTESEARSGLQSLHPDWDSDQIQAAIAAEKKKSNSRIAQ